MKPARNTSPAPVVSTACTLKPGEWINRSPSSAIAPSARYDESDVMLDPWCELPQQGKRIPNVSVYLFTARLG